MSRIEQENLFTNFRRNKVITEHVETNDCVWGVTAAAFNALVKPEIPLSGKDVQTIAGIYNLTKEDFDEVVNKLGGHAGSNKFGVGYINARGRTENEVFDLYTRIIDSGSLIFVGVDSEKWYRSPSSRKFEHGLHAVLIHGYEINHTKILNKKTKKLLIRDPNIKPDLKVKFEDLSRSVRGPLTLYDVVIFHLTGTKIQEIM